MNKLLTSAAFSLCVFASSTAFAGEKIVTLAVQNMYCPDCRSSSKRASKSCPALPRWRCPSRIRRRS